MSENDNIYGMASVGIVSLRKEPEDAAEMVSQLLLGELFQFIDRDKKWWQIKALLGDYKGWINGNEGYLLSGKERKEWLERNHNLQNRSPYYTFRAGNKYDQCLIPSGAVINICGDSIHYPFGEYKICTKPTRLKKNELLETALSFLGTPYLWGGRTDTGIDCSGFIQAVLLQHGIIFPRDSIDQSQTVPLIRIDTIEDVEIKRGDIIYFNPKSHRISHVGFYLGNGLLLHAGGKVKVQQIDPNHLDRSYVDFNSTLAKSVAGYQKRQDIYKLKAKNDSINTSKIVR